MARAVLSARVSAAELAREAVIDKAGFSVLAFGVI